ncbi:TonB-dependent receptor plug domain-containing protein [Pseudidiomarina halophila]|uniref:TonB-dependent receptor n=1 Tax=Pseudidiomarina halophila TaxID=1449799 RepID=A0A432XS09_9GAMM|nr:TonB-dependent receptor [Pseudidiomarina halophila]RUO51470.1 TonB-dependent receptor [Pseudidiomarina halophila]
MQINKTLLTMISAGVVTGTAAFSTGVFAQEQEGTAIEAEERIQVIGSRLSMRTATDGAAPVDIISSEELTASGITETARALQYAVPSFNFPSSSITDGSDAVRPASLRGLSPDHTLVLVNGKRRHMSALVHLNGTTGRGSSNVDLNAIPISSIKRIEVLRDGAAALYGSDAIAGVINIVLKDQAEGGSLTAVTGQTYEGDGEQYKVHGNVGFELGNDGHLTLSAEYHHKNKTNRAGFDPRQQYPLVDGELDPREQTFDRLNHHVGDAEFENKALFANASIALGDGELYAFGGVSDRTTQSGAFYRRALDSRNIIEVYPDGFLPLLTPETSDVSGYVGYRFDLGQWQVDASTGYGESEFQYRVENSINASIGPSSQTEFDAGTLITDEMTATVDFSRFVPFVNNSDLSVAFGISYRENSYQIRAGEEASYIDGGYNGRAAGSQGFTGFKPESEVDQSRDNTGVYVEVENMLTADFLWGAAVRYEDYSDFGSNTSWKVSGRYDLSDEWAIRATANTGFRAPSVQQLYFSNISTLFVDRGNGLQPEQSGTFNNISDVARELGIEGLEPEESQSFSAGLVFNGYDGFTLTIDAFQIAIDDRIILSGDVSPQDSAAVADALAASGADNARFFVNAVDTTTRGVDVVASKTFQFAEYGELRTQLAYGYNKTEIDDVNLPALLDGLEDNLFDGVERTRMTRSVPRNSGSIAFTHTLSDLETRLAFNYFGDYTLENSQGVQTEFGAKWVTDLSAKYRLNNQLSVSAGVQNLFDEYPDKQRPGSQFNGIFMYPLTNAPFGFNGGYYYAELTYNF